MWLHGSCPKSGLKDAQTASVNGYKLTFLIQFDKFSHPGIYNDNTLSNHKFRLPTRLQPIKVQFTRTHSNVNTDLQRKHNDVPIPNTKDH